MRIAFLSLLLALVVNVYAQKSTVALNSSYLHLPWKTVATRMPTEWYASDSAKKVAETVLYCQQDIGGWAKNKPYHHPLTDSARAEIEKNKSGVGATIDNGATINEMKFLAKMYDHTKDVRYFNAFERGLN